MAYRRVRSLQAVHEQVNRAFPNRDKASDGWIGDTSHSARKSDHNPDSNGLVHAIDVDEDDKVGDQVVGRLLWQWVQETKPDWFKYGIYEANEDWGGIISSYSHPDGPKWKPRKYSGWNPHNKHMHLSAKDDRPFSGVPFDQWIKDKTMPDDNWIDDRYPDWVHAEGNEKVKELIKEVFTKDTDPREAMHTFSVLRWMLILYRVVRFALKS